MPEFKRPEWAVLNLDSKDVQTDLNEADISFLCFFLTEAELDRFRVLHRTFDKWKKISNVPAITVGKAWSRTLSTPHPGTCEPRKKPLKKKAELIKDSHQADFQPSEDKNFSSQKEEKADEKKALKPISDLNEVSFSQENTEKSAHTIGKATRLIDQAVTHAKTNSTSINKVDRSNAISESSYTGTFGASEAPVGLLNTDSLMLGNNPSARKKVIKQKMLVSFLDLEIDAIPVGQVKWPVLRLEGRISVDSKDQRILIQFNGEEYLMSATIEDYSNEKKLHPIRLQDSDMLEKLKANFKKLISS